jgi:hypothetical protein
MSDQEIVTIFENISENWKIFQLSQRDNFESAKGPHQFCRPWGNSTV